MKRLYYICLAAFALVVCAQGAWSQLASSTWPKFHRDYAATGMSLFGGTGSELSWTFTAGGAIQSSPVIGADNTAYFTCADGKLYAIRGAGVSLWTNNLKAVSTISPAIGADGVIYVGATDKYLCAVKPDGVVKWKKLLGSIPNASISIAPDGTIYAACQNGALYAFDINGTQKWLFSAGAAISSSPAIGSDGALYFGCQDSKIYAVTSAGAKKWPPFIPSGAAAFYASPAIGSDGTIYIGSSNGYFYAINPTGSMKWRINSGGDVRSSAAIYSNGSIYYGCRDGKIHALSSLSPQLWTFATGQYVDSSPALGSDGGIFAASLNGKLYALNPDGTERWNFDAGSPIYSSPAMGPGGALLIGADNGILYCFTADSTPPGAPTVTDDGVYTGQSDRLHGSWAAADQESGIYSYEYCIGAAPGLADIAPWLNTAGAAQHTRTGLSLTDKQVYYITVRAINGAGLTGPEASSDGITLDGTPPTRPSVTDDGAFSSDNTKLHATWASSDPESGIGRYEYSLGTTAGGTNILTWTDAGTNSSFTKTGLSLQQGATYYINVRAYNNTGNVSQIGSSDGIVIDTASPPAPVVTDDGNYTASTNTLHAIWTTVTCASGVASYEYSIGTSAGALNIRNWTDVGLQTSVTATDLSLTNGITYYINVRARNSVGKAGYIGSADGIAVDSTPPSKPVVTDDGIYTSSTRLLAANWSSSDPESGVVEYFYAVGTTPEGADIRGWTSAGAQTTYIITSLNMLDGTKYYISAKARNAAGAESAVGTSDGITVDSTPPSAPVVTDDGNYLMDATKLHATWSAADPQSGIIRYEYSVGTAAGITDVLAWTDAGTATDFTIANLNLVSGLRYYVNVRATNGAHTIGAVGSSDGIFAESTPPTTPEVIDDGDFTLDTARLHATWSSEDPETGVTLFEYSIGTSPGDANVVGWTAVGLSTSLDKTGMNLAQGVTYYINVRATNGVGMVSEIGASDGITVDTTPPEIVKVTDTGEYTADNTQLHATFECSDPESGISGYECAVGTIPGGSDISNWQNVGPDPETVIIDLQLQDGVIYYISARAINGAGVPGPMGSSDGIKVDATPPVDVVAYDDGVYCGLPDKLHGRWSATDPESGIASYKYCIGTEPGLNDVADWLDVGSSTEDTREGLTLTNGSVYYITVIAVNVAGSESQPVSSDGIKCDLTPATVPVVTDNGKYWGYKTNMPASWSSEDPESGIVGYRTSIGTAPSLADVADWLELGMITSYTRTGLMLKDGITYYINVQAENGAGVWSETGSSDGIMLDSTPPTTPIVTDDGDGTLMLDRLHAKWRSEDPESGIVEYMYCIGTSPGAIDVKPWTSAGTSEDITVTGLKLEPMLTYYFSVKSKNDAGAWSAVSASDGIQFSTGAAIWWKFHNNTTNVGRQIFKGTRVNDLAWSVETQGFVESSAAIASDGTAYIGSGDGKVYAVTQNGTLRWTFNTGGPIDSSPAVAVDGRIVIGSNNGKVYCLNPAGEVVWTYTAGGAVRSSALISNGRVYIACNDKSLYALNLETGAKLWSYKTGDAIWSSPACDTNGVIYFCSGDSYIYAINPDGTRKWRYLTGSAADSSPAIGEDGTIYAGSGDGYFYAINPIGTLKWRYFAGIIADSSAAIGLDGNIYFGAGIDGGDGAFYALSPSGSKIWSINFPGGGIISSPAIDSTGMIYVGSADEHIRAINPDGTICWTFKTGSSVASSPALGADSSVVFGSYDGKIYCLRDMKARDLTPPTTPVVIVPATLASGQPLTALWSATDPDSMVAEYVYAIGSAPGQTDVSYWTIAGIETGVTRLDLALIVGQTYYVSVKARNSSQRWSEIGVSQGVVIGGTAITVNIAQAKKLADNTIVSMNGKVVGAVFNDCFFVQEPNRIAGIRCVFAGANLISGDTVNLIGDVSTLNDAKTLSSVTFTQTATGPAPAPLGLCGKLRKDQMPDPFGLNVKIWGRVTSVGPGYCIINGHTGAQPAGAPTGIELRSAEITAASGDFVTASGILCAEKVGEQITTVLRVKTPGAVVVAPK
ncbi:MAG: PQQ-binding-like beta-propeller repeat protein [Armatimonadetes bacterium]|nr:PQQ-binding-like beta-propeller repeat protein [Armatimonadota bacterium]